MSDTCEYVLRNETFAPTAASFLRLVQTRSGTRANDTRIIRIHLIAFSNQIHKKDESKSGKLI
jgi:hypothetical protein